MRISISKWARVLVAAALVAPTAARAETTPEALEWLRGIAAIYEKAPLSVDLEMTISARADAPRGGSVRGSLLLKDRTHQRVEMSMEMGGAQGQSVSVGILSVTDGTTAWNEMDVPGMGKQVLRFALDDAAVMARGAAMAPGIGSMDPLAQIQKLSTMMDFEVAGTEGGRVTLEGTITEAGRAAMGPKPVMAMERVTLALDVETGFPVELAIGADEPAITMEFSNLELLEESALPAGAFEYTPPQGVPVMDGAQLLRMQAGGGGA